AWGSRTAGQATRSCRCIRVGSGFFVAKARTLGSSACTGQRSHWFRARGGASSTTRRSRDRSPERSSGGRARTRQLALEVRRCRGLAERRQELLVPCRPLLDEVSRGGGGVAGS